MVRASGWYVVVFEDVGGKKVLVAQKCDQYLGEDLEIDPDITPESSAVSVSRKYVKFLLDRGIESYIQKRGRTLGYWDWNVYIPSGLDVTSRPVYSVDTALKLENAGWKYVKTVGERGLIYIDPHGDYWGISGASVVPYKSLEDAEFDLWAGEHVGELTPISEERGRKLEEDILEGREIDLQKALGIPKEEGVGEPEYIGEEYTVEDDKSNGKGKN